jgi:hypothetical protein
MNRRQKRALERWLHHERSGDDVHAERALSRLLAGLPPVAVPAGFAERVLRAGGFGVRGRRPRLGVPAWVWQTAFGVWLVSSFLVAAGAIGFASDVARSRQIVGLGSRVLVELSRFGAELATAVGALWRAGQAVANVLSGPTMLALVVVCALSSLVSLRALASLMASERSSRHA